MIDKLIELSVMSGGLLPLMGVLLLITLAVIIERSYFFHKVLKSGLAMEHDLQLVEYQNAAKLGELATHYDGSLQRSIISSALASRGSDAQTMDRHIEEAIMWQMPKIDKHVWVLDTSVTLAPLMGLLGTIIGMVHAFDILGTAGTGGAATKMVTGGIAEALVATGAGLFIAIIAVLFLNHFNKRVRLALHQMDLLKVMVINRLYGGGSTHQGVSVREAHAAGIDQIRLTEIKAGAVKHRTRGGYFDASKPRVEVIPMIDIMMFLLVFFVVISLNMIAGSGVQMEIPSSKTTQELKASTVTVGVTKDGKVVVSGKPVTPDELKAKLNQLKKDGPVDVVLAGDKDVPLQMLLGVMDTIRGSGISSVGIAAIAEKK